MQTVYTEEELRDLAREKAAIYAANKILDIEILIIKSDEPRVIPYMVDQISQITFVTVMQGVDMNLLATVKRARRKARENLK